jgi:putative ABC transport system substrate-binding protein
VSSKNIETRSLTRIFILVCLLPALFLPAGTGAQQPAKIPRIGYLTATPLVELERRTAPLRDGLKELGYVDGKNIEFIYRSSEGKGDVYATLAAELVALKVDVIVTDITGAALGAKKATSTIPIVMTTSTDPVDAGLVASLARPGGNVTGLTNAGAELGGKHLELLKESAPKINRVAILTIRRSAAHEAFLKQIEAPSRALGVQLISSIIQSPGEFDDAFRNMAKEQVNGLANRLQPNAYAGTRARVAELAIKYRLPSIAGSTSWVQSGGLLSYGADLNAQARRAAVYVDKILKGAKPADLPIEAPMKYHFAINLKTAKRIGVTVPDIALSRADRVIK